MSVTQSAKITYHLERLPSDLSGGDIQLSFPDRYSEIGLSDGDTIYTEHMDDEEPEYIWGEQTEEEGTTTEGYYTFHKGGGIQIPSRMDDFIKEPTYFLVVEIHPGDNPHYRVYNHRDYIDHRLKELEEQGYDVEEGEPLTLPIIGGTAAELTSSDTVIDIAARTPYDGQEFRVVPFDAKHRMFSDGFGRASEQEFTPDIDTFQQAVKKGQIPECQARKLSIKWSLESKYSYNQRDWTVADSSPDREVVATVSSVEELSVVLPSKGAFELVAKNVMSENSTWVSHAPDGHKPHQRLIGGNWYTKFHNDDASYTVYVPC